VHGDYVIVRYNPALSDSTEIIQAVTLVQVGGLANIAPGEGGGNSPTEERTSTDDFFDDIGENCFAIVQDHVGIDFRDPPRDIDPLLRGQNDYIFMQLELTDTTIDFGWQCRDPNYCPVTELSRLHLDHRQKALMLKIDWDAVQYIENGEFL
jgi:hypothetical protein